MKTPNQTQHVDFNSSRRGEDRRNARRWVRANKSAFLLSPLDTRI